MAPHLRLGTTRPMASLQLSREAWATSLARSAPRSNTSSTYAGSATISAYLQGQAALLSRPAPPAQLASGGNPPGCRGCW
jgi:hypothetical protein